MDRYLNSNTGSLTPTAKAIAEDNMVQDNGNVDWWLRTPGIFANYAAYVLKDGSLRDYGQVLSSVHQCAVRPALWVEI